MEIKTPSVEEGGNHITHYKGFILHTLCFNLYCIDFSLTINAEDGR